MKGIGEEIKRDLRELEPRHGCLAPARKSSCGKPCIAGHTVQKAALEQIAAGGKVYTTRWNRFVKPGGDGVIQEERDPELVATKTASTVKLLCGEHDRGLFTPIERGAFFGTKDQLRTVLLRSCLNEAQSKMFQRACARDTIRMFRDLGTSLLLKSARWEEKECAGAIRKLRREIRENAPWRNHRGKRRLLALGIHLEEPPHVMGTGIFYAEGVTIERRGRGSTSAGGWRGLIAWASGTYGKNGWMCLATREENDGGPEPGRAFIQAIQDLGTTEVLGELLQVGFEKVENLYMAPAWWDDLPDESRRQAWKLAKTTVRTDEDPPLEKVRDWGTLPPHTVEWYEH